MSINDNLTTLKRKMADKTYAEALTKKNVKTVEEYVIPQILEVEAEKLEKKEAEELKKSIAEIDRQIYLKTWYGWYKSWFGY